MVTRLPNISYSFDADRTSVLPKTVRTVTDPNFLVNISGGSRLSQRNKEAVVLLACHGHGHHDVT